MGVLALCKPGKDDYTIPRSYRPISLLPIMGKIMEIMVSRRLSRLLQSRRLLSPFQFGFRTGKKMMRVCSRLAHDIVQSFRQ